MLRFAFRPLQQRLLHLPTWQRCLSTQPSPLDADLKTSSVNNNEDTAAIPEGITVVTCRKSAERALQELKKVYNDRNRVFACDTEVVDISIKKESPVGHGTIICASVYGGEDLDFGSGPGLWIDNMDNAKGILQLFKPFFEDASQKKVFHNYSFDRHVLFNHDINCVGLAGDTLHMARLFDASRSSYSLEALSNDYLLQRKVPMKERFSKKAILRNGMEGKTSVLPPLGDLQRESKSRGNWIDCSVFDAKATWDLYQKLCRCLEDKSWTNDESLLDFYKRYSLPFGELLTDMERTGVFVRSKDYLPKVEQQARRDAENCTNAFIEWAATVCPDAKFMDVRSAAQKQQFFFAPKEKDESHQLSPTRAFTTDNTERIIELNQTKPKAKMLFVLEGQGLSTSHKSASGAPSASAVALRELCGSNPTHPTDPVYGTAYEHFGAGERGARACVAIDSLLQVGKINTLINTYMEPLQKLVDKNSRIHCSMNINTTTGRLSARLPNLPNQPAYDKDIYKIRDAFAAQPGNTLIVADYAQLELRVLAHMTRCTSMIKAFAAGGDFHSRTAMGMYPEIADAVQRGEVLLEWDHSQGEAPVPLLKDVYGTMRRAAKMLNFSIAYGKTAHGLSKDWGVTLEEAEQKVERWYNDRPEVRQWQENTIREAQETFNARTLMGRYRFLEHINSPHYRLRSSAERAAINTPIQGGAADVVMAAMLKISRNQTLKDLGFKLILQIHDEVILEGPEEHAVEGLKLVKQCMESPFEAPLSVDLIADGTYAPTWYQAK